MTASPLMAPIAYATMSRLQTMERIGRRSLLKGGIGLGVLSSLQDDPASIRPKEGDSFIRVGDASKKPLSPDDIPIGLKQTMAWAMDSADGTVRSGSRLNRILLMRFEPERLSSETQARAAAGVVAYTAICTHSGCEVEEWIT